MTGKPQYYLIKRNISKNMNLRVVIQYGEKLDSIQLGPLGEVASVGEKERLSVGEEEGFF